MKVTARDRRLLTLYGITGAEYDLILKSQGGVCFVCQRPPRGNRLAVDHRHSDGLVRGVLCWSCNSALERLRDSATNALRLHDYLLIAPAVVALGRQVYGRIGRATRKWRTKRERRERLAWVAEKVVELDRGRRRGKTMKRLTLYIVWYFLSFGGYTGNIASVVGPFDLKRECEATRMTIRAKMVSTLECWSVGK